MEIDPRLVEAIFREVWDKAGEKVAQATVGRGWARFDWRRAATAYAEKMRTLYGYTRFLGQNRPIPLDEIFTDVHILDRPSAMRRFDPATLEAAFREGQRDRGLVRHEGLSVVERHKKLFILGKPGAGKTTFLKHVALEALRPGNTLARLPIFITLKELADSNLSLRAFIVQQFDVCHFPAARPYLEQLLHAGKALVLFDGLDEVTQSDHQQARLIQEIRDFSDDTKQCQHCITCRIAATDYTFERFTYVEMADFTPQQIDVFARRWFRTDVAKGEAFLNELHRPDHTGLQEMAQVPLLLSLLCLNYEETQVFPARRVELYEEALDALLKKWDASRNIQRDPYRLLSLGRKKQLFAEVAAKCFDAGHYFVPQATMEAHILAYLQHLPPSERDDPDPTVALKSIEAQHGIFVERARRVYSFAHLTFQEYYTARYIADNAHLGTLERLIVPAHLTDDRWREVFLNVASLLPNADYFFELFLRALDSIIGEDETLAEILAWAEGEAVSVKVNYQEAAVRAFYILLVRYFINRDVKRDDDANYNLVLNRGSSFNLDRILAVACEPNLGLSIARARGIHKDRKMDSQLNLFLHFTTYLYHAEIIVMAIIDIKTNVTDEYFTNLSSFCGIPTGYISKARREATASCNEYRSKLLKSKYRIRLFDEYAINSCNLLAKLDSIPAADSELQDWILYRWTIETASRTWCRELGMKSNWDSNVTRLNLEHYLAATRLLVDCLNLAYVTDRAGIEARLLLPPRTD